MVAVYLPGVSFAIASARPCAKAFTVSQSSFGVSGTTTWRPLPPVVFTKLSSRIPLAHLIRGVDQRGPRDVLSRVEIKGYPVRRLYFCERRAPGMDLQHACLDESDEAVEVLDIEHLIVADVPPLD